MVVCVSLEYRFKRTPDGAVWTPTTFPYAFWQRYLTVFEAVRIIARVGAVPQADSSWQRVDGPGVTLGAVPDYHGPREFAGKILQVQRATRAAVQWGDAVIMRVSSTLAECIEPKLRSRGYPYAVEVVADPYDVFAPGSVRHPLRPFLRWYAPLKLRRQCSRACAAAYVTRMALQQRYPCPKSALGISDVELPDQAFRAAPRSWPEPARPLTLIFIGLLDQFYKAPDVLIDAVAHCVRQGLDLQLIMVGDGQQRARLAEQARQHGLGERVHFRGLLRSGASVWAELDRADVFVLPSRQEGLPRAMVEAMARGLPCIGAQVGGIPELLEPQDLVEPGNTSALATKIVEVAGDPARMERMSARNLREASAYHDAALTEQRTAFYRQVQHTTENWLRRTAQMSKPGF